MPPVSPTLSPVAEIHPALRGFMARQGLRAQDLRSDGRLTLTIDGKYRVHLYRAPHQRMAISAQLLDLSGRYGTPATEHRLERLMNLAAGMLQQHPSSLCLDPERQTLQLQQTLTAHTDAAGLETALGEFVNALAFWHRVAAAEATV